MERREQEVESHREKARELDATIAAQHRLASSGLPPAYVNGKRGVADLDDGPDTDGYRTARRVCANLVSGSLVDGRGMPIPWVYLYGPNGTHKSTLACCSALELMRLGKRVKYILWPEALDDLRGLNRDDASESVSQFIRRLVEVPHLTVDEIGLGTPTPFAAEKLFVMIERRYQEDSAADPGERSTIFTSNRSASELAETFAHIDDGLGGRRLARRISDMATAINVAEINVTS
jgi:DNA replication protein DnaC